jgi:hypothetical protein
MAMQSTATIDVRNLSSRRLWDILRLAELDNLQVTPTVLARVREELAARNHHGEAQRWRAPH